MIGIGQAFGALAEARFLRVCSEKKSETPEWFVGVKEASIEWDLRGVDAFAYFTALDGSRRVKVPIQVKSSKDGAANFKKEQSASKVRNILVIVVSTSKPDEHIRQKLYAELGMIRNKELIFDEFLATEIQKPYTGKTSDRNRVSIERMRKYRAETS